MANVINLLTSIVAAGIMLHVWLVPDSIGDFILMAIFAGSVLWVSEYVEKREKAS